MFEYPGKRPGQVKPTNIRHAHFSRNPKIAAFLKAYHFVKEFGEGFDRICREQEANGANAPSFRTDEFILKITVPKVAEKVTVNVTEKVNATENVIDVSQKTSQKRGERLTENRHGLIDKHQKLIEKLIEKAKMNGVKLIRKNDYLCKVMFKDPLGNTYASYEEYVNSPNLDTVLIWLKLWRGERTPQNDEERHIKMELDEMDRKGIIPEFNFD